VATKQDSIQYKKHRKSKIVAKTTQGQYQASATIITPNAILTKYNEQNRPKLGDSPSPSDVESWALQLQALQTTELQNTWPY
jgi:hypothetical protein